MKLTKTWVLLCCFSLIIQIFLPQVSNAELYTWKDRNGVVRRTYYPPPADQVWGNTPSHPSVTVRDQVREPVRQDKVELFVTSWCPYCKKAIAYFESKGIAYKAYDIEKDAQAASRKNKLDGRGGVPFAIVNGTLIHGYDPDSYTNALNE